MSTIDRVRFYDGEFLRAFDFSDEQTYHMEMRRRLNRYLHLYGIVQGLQLSEDVSAGVHQISILQGMAIDAFGREIYVFAPYTLGDADITANRIPAAGGAYDVWLRYSKTPATPPSAGYGVCNQANQYTRWLESFTVVLKHPSHPFTPPAFSDDDTDDPSQDQVGVLLGTVQVSPGSTSEFSAPELRHRHFLGIIAQRIQAPPGYDATQANPPFSFLNANPAAVRNTPLTPPVSLEIEPNIFADQNLIVGPDFPLTSTAASKIPIQINNTGPLATSGSVKIAGDLFVQGNVYSPTVTGGTQNWNPISAYVQQLVTASVPDVLTDSEFATISSSMPLSGKGSTPSKPLISTRLLNPFSNVVPIAFVLSSTLDTSVVSPGDSVTLSIDSVTFSPNPPTSNQVTLNANWTALPVDGSGKCAFKSFAIFFIAVCFA